MPVHNNATLETHHLPGLEHQTLAGSRDGLGQMEVWRQRIAAGAATPEHRHDCEEVIVILEGNGTYTVEGKSTPLKAHDVVTIPPGVLHQVVAGDEEILLVASFAMAPVRVQSADGNAMPLPWDGPA